MTNCAYVLVYININLVSPDIVTSSEQSSPDQCPPSNYDHVSWKTLLAPLESSSSSPASSASNDTTGAATKLSSSVNSHSTRNFSVSGAPVTNGNATQAKNYGVEVDAGCRFVHSVCQKYSGRELAASEELLPANEKGSAVFPSLPATSEHRAVHADTAGLVLYKVRHLSVGWEMWI